MLTPVRKRYASHNARSRGPDGQLVEGARSNPDVRFNCKLCGKKTSYFCATHSDRAAKNIIWLCMTNPCHADHAQAELEQLLRSGAPQMNAQF
jgi:hypothetical protein